MKTLYTYSKTLSGYLMALAMAMFTYSVNAQTNHDVIIVGNSFSPASLTITVGDQVTFTNEAGGGNHNVNGTIATFSGNPESFSNPEGVVDAFVYVWTCTAAGFYDYQCDPHAAGGMVGTITAAAAPCENAAQYPFDAITVVGVDVITINGCNYEEEYSVITAIQAGGSYEFTADGPTTYITIRQGSVGGTVLAEGFSPLTGVAATADDIYVHWNADASCGTASNCMSTTVQDVSPPCENANMYPSSALDVSLVTGAQDIATDVWTGDYSVVTGLTTGNYYQVNVTGGTWITVREGAVAGPLLAAGVGAVAFTSAAGADVYIHYNTEAITCGEAGGIDLVATIEEFGAAPCENTSLYGSATASAVDGETVVITAFAYAGSEYSIVDGIQNGYEYEVSHEAGSYITVRSGAVGGPVLASGYSPLQFAGGASATVYIHYTADDACTQDATGSWATEITSLGFAPCENAFQWPAAAVTPDAGGAVTQIDDDQYDSGEYSVITGIVDATNYRFTHSNGAFITVREGAVDGPVVGSGVSPLNVTTSSISDLYVHWNEDIACNVAGVAYGYITTVQLLVGCTAEAGTLTADASPVCLVGGSADISATEVDAPVVPVGYTTLYVLTQGAGLVIVDANTVPEFTVTAADDYIIHTLVYDPATVDPSSLPAGTTGFDVNGLLIQGGGVICGSLDVTGAPITVEDCPDNDLCLNAITIACGGTVTGSTVDATNTDELDIVPGPGIWYLFAGTGDEVTVSTDNAGTDYDTRIGYTDACGNAGLDFDEDGGVDFVNGWTSVLTFPTTPGTDYYIYVGGYLGTNTGAFEMTVSCTPPCTVDAGTLSADASPVCLVGGSADISATEVDAPVVPVGYTTLYVLTQGAGLVIVDANTVPEFTVTAADDYIIHTLVYDPTTVDPSSLPAGTTGFDVNGLLIQGGGSICGALDVTGAPVTVDVCIGMQETLDAGLSIYPNPSSGNFLVTVNGVDASIVLNVTDVAGRLVYTEAATISNSYRNELNLDLADGSYLLSIVTEEGTVVRRIQVAK